MKRYITLIAVLLFTHAALQAQVPGYQGIRSSMKIGLGGFPNILQPAVYDFYVPHLSQRITLDYVLTRQYAVQVGLQHASNPLDLDGDIEMLNPLSPENNRARSFTILANLLMYSKARGFIAPHGMYYQLGIAMSFVSRMDMDNEATLTYTDGGPVIGIGRQFILANRLLIAVGVEANAAMGSIIRANNSDDPIEAALAKRHATTQALQATISFGFLAF